MIRSVADLVDVPSNAWPDVQRAAAAAPVPVDVLPVDQAAAAASLHSLQVTTGSVLGALAYNCGGILIDHGWVRLLAGGTPELPGLAAANNLDAPVPHRAPPPWLLIGFDVLGGRFAIDGGGLGVAAGQVCYWAPDTLEWEGLEMGHAAFIKAFLGGATGEFYAPMRWADWEAEVSGIRLDQGIAMMPPPFTSQGDDVESVARRAVPFSELLAFYEQMAVQAGGVAPGQTFDLSVD